MSLLKPEILAPAGNWDCVRAAVANGADAVYFGLDQFNARMRADNFTREDLATLVPFLHECGVRAYVTMNVLIFPAEMEQAMQYVDALDAAGVDAVIVQDLGLADLIAKHRREGRITAHLYPNDCEQPRGCAAGGCAIRPSTDCAFSRAFSQRN